MIGRRCMAIVVVARGIRFITYYSAIVSLNYYACLANEFTQRSSIQSRKNFRLVMAFSLLKNSFSCVDFDIYGHGGTNVSTGLFRLGCVSWMAAHLYNLYLSKKRGGNLAASREDAVTREKFRGKLIVWHYLICIFSIVCTLLGHCLAFCCRKIDYWNWSTGNRARWRSDPN